MLKVRSSCLNNSLIICTWKIGSSQFFPIEEENRLGLKNYILFDERGAGGIKDSDNAIRHGKIQNFHQRYKERNGFVRKPTHPHNGLKGQ